MDNVTRDGVTVSVLAQDEPIAKAIEQYLIASTADLGNLDALNAAVQPILEQIERLGERRDALDAERQLGPVSPELAAEFQQTLSLIRTLGDAVNAIRASAKVRIIPPAQV